MAGSHLSNPGTLSVTAITVAALMIAGPVRAADPTFGQPPLGQPIVLFSPDTATATPAPRHAAAAAPAKRPTTPVQRMPLDGRPLIPPANVPAKLGAPPDPQPALSLETDLRPVGANADQPMPLGTAPPAARPSSPLPPSAAPPSG